MEELNKNQIVLLTLLVSFVTSIATGIVTVSLLDQAPPGVTQTINRIVERTVERVVPGETRIETVVKEVPIIVTEEELIVRAIADATPAVVDISTTVGTTTLTQTGFLVSAEGLVLTSVDLATMAGPSATWNIAVPGRATFVAEPVVLDPALASGFLALKIKGVVTGQTDTAASQPFPYIKLAEHEAVAGQTVITLQSPTGPGDSVSVGIISRVGPGDDGAMPLIHANAITASARGGPVLNTKGEAVGLIKFDQLAYTLNSLKPALDKLLKK